MARRIFRSRTITRATDGCTATSPTTSSSGDWHETLNFDAHRYLREDIGYGLALLVSVGHWAGVPCPVAEGLLTLGGVVSGNDFRNTGRTLANLGLAGASRDEMTRVLQEGL